VEGDNTQFDANPYSAELLTLEPADGSAYSFQFVSPNFNGVLGHIAMHALSPNLNVSLRASELVSRWARSIYCEYLRGGHAKLDTKTQSVR